MTKIFEQYRNKILKTYGTNEDFNYVGFGMNIVEVQKGLDNFVFTFQNTPPNKSSLSSFFLYCMIPTFRNLEDTEEIPKQFFGKISLHHFDNKFDGNGVNLGNFLSDKLGLKTKNKKFRNIRVDVDTKTSENFNPETAIEKPMKLNLLDADGNYFYNFTIDWKKKSAFITIPKKNLEYFIEIYFPSSSAKQKDKIVIPECEKIIDTKKIKGFDISGEPYIEICDSGMLKLVFNFMPPLNGNDNPSTLRVFSRFDKELEKTLSTKIIWEDREIMLIPTPNEDTIKTLTEYLESFWNNQKSVTDKLISKNPKKQTDTSFLRLILNIIKTLLR